MAKEVEIEELIGNNTCEDKDVPPDTGELLTLQQQCEETVDYLLSRSPDVIPWIYPR